MWCWARRLARRDGMGGHTCGSPTPNSHCCVSPESQSVPESALALVYALGGRLSERVLSVPAALATPSTSVGLLHSACALRLVVRILLLELAFHCLVVLDRHLIRVATSEH